MSARDILLAVASVAGLLGAAGAAAGYGLRRVASDVGAVLLPVGAVVAVLGAIAVIVVVATALGAER